MKSFTVHDPRGVVWHLWLTTEMVKTASLERAIAASDMPDREKRKAYREMGIPGFFHRPGFFDSYRWRVGWGREHSYAWIMHAAGHGEHQAWISPARRRKGALADLDRLAAQIKLGEEPRPSPP